jgi:hypothetical protein
VPFEEKICVRLIKCDLELIRNAIPQQNITEKYKILKAG